MNIFRTKEVWNQQTKNKNRFSIRFSGLNALLDEKRLAKFPESVRMRLAAVKDAVAFEKFKSNNVTGFADTLELALDTVKLPVMKVGVTEIPRFNDQVRVLTRFEKPEDLTVTFFDYVNGSASAIMSLWQSLVADKRTGAMGFKEDYILPQAYFFKYGPDAPGYEPAAGEAIPWLEAHRIVNLWPLSIDHGDFDQNAGEPIKITCTFSIDNIYPIDYRSYTSQGVESGTGYSSTQDRPFKVEDIENLNLTRAAAIKG